MIAFFTISAFYIIYEYGRYPNTDGIFITPIQSILQLFAVADGDFEGNYWNLKKSVYSVIGRVSSSEIVLNFANTNVACFFNYQSFSGP